MELIIAKRLKELRAENKISQKDLAMALGCQPTTIARIESNQSDPSCSYAWKIADFFHVSIDYLIGRTDVRKMQSVDEDASQIIKDTIAEYLSENKNTYEEIRNRILENISKEEEKK